MALLYGEDIPTSRELLSDVFRDGYADGYVGDDNFLRDYILRAQVAVLDDRHKELNGAALVLNSRITAIATRTDREKYGSRFQNLVGLLQVARLVDNNVWISIGVNAKEAMKAAAHQAGMNRSKDEELLKARLERFETMASYAIRSDGSGLLISLNGSRHGAGYWQEVWC